jgi:hypothetical protein
MKKPRKPFKIRCSKCPVVLDTRTPDAQRAADRAHAAGWKIDRIVDRWAHYLCPGCQK